MGAYIRGGLYPRRHITEGAYIRGTYNRGGLHPRGLITEEAYNWNIKKRVTTRYSSADQIRFAFTGSINNRIHFIHKNKSYGGGGGAYNRIYCFANG